MAGVIPNSLERTSSLDGNRMAGSTRRILGEAVPVDFVDKRRGLVRDRLSHSLESDSGKCRGLEHAALGRGRLFGLVLDRTAALAGTAAKLALCSCPEPGPDDIGGFCEKIDDKRGV
jgi:hypothetical protein